MFSEVKSDINVDQLMHQIRTTVAQRREIKELEKMVSGPVHELPANLISPGSEAHLELQPDFEPHTDRKYHVNDFLKYHGSTFIANAYLGLLNRPPDSHGSDQHLAALESGTLNKLDVLAKLHYSTEGKAAGVRVTGLALPAFVRRLERVPIAGYVVSVIIAVARLPNLHRSRRASEFHLLAQLERLAQHYSALHLRLVENLQQLFTEINARTSDHQRAIAALIGRQQRLQEQLAKVRDELSEDLSATQISLTQAQNGLTESQSGLERRLTDEAIALHDELERTERELAASQARLSTEVNEKLSDLKRLHELLHREVAEQLPGGSLSPLASSEERVALDHLYAAFEDEFRGERAEIKSRLQVYLPIVRKAGIRRGALDLGCGRGEWLELLRDEGVESYGVDQNTVLVERCRQIGLTVVEADAIHHLRSLPDASLEAVTGFHIVEHVPFAHLITMLSEIERVLKPGGLVILETPNPENLMVGSHTFYTDPTHRNPIPSVTLKFLLGARGFTQIEIMKLRPWHDANIAESGEVVRRFNEYFYGAPDYGIIAYKA